MNGREGSQGSSAQAFVRSISLVREQIPDFHRYPFCVPAIRSISTLDLDSRVTLFVGDNGSGKSTLIEAIAMVAGFNPEGGTRNFKFSTRASESDLCRFLRVIRGTRRERTGFFFRAESFFNLGTEIESLDSVISSAPRIVTAYGGRSLHEQSHGESFLALIKNRFGPDGLYILDEPEAALSPSRQLTLLARIHELAHRGRSQFIIATHSPIVLAYPHATIYQLSESGIGRVAYEETEHFFLTREFLLNRERFFRELFDE